VVGELAATSHTTTKTLRFYERVGLLAPPRLTRRGYRDYGPETLHRLQFIRRGRAAGLTLAQIREVLDIRDAGTAPCNHVQLLLDDRLTSLDQQLADLHALRDTVAGLLEAAATVEPASCHPAAVCRYL